MKTIRLYGKEYTVKILPPELQVVSDPAYTNDIPDNSANLAKFIEDFVNVFDICDKERIRNMQPVLISIAEETKMQFVKQLLDSAIVGDDVAILAAKILEEDAELVDELIISMGKAISDVLSSHELIAMVVSKALTDSTVASEALLTSVAKPLLDNATNSDTASITAFKQFSELTNSTDVFSRVVDFNRNIEDIINLDEILSAIIVKNLSDGTFHQDAVRILTGKAVFDTVGHLETLLKSVAKHITDSPLISDKIQKHITRSFTDIVTVESITPEFLTGVLSEIAIAAAVSDQSMRHANKVISTLVDFEESIEIYKQSYFLEDYASEKYTGELFNI